MPRKKTKALQREIGPDRKYNSVLVQRLINKTMLSGKKQLAERVVYTAMELAAKNVKSEDPITVLEKAVSNISPKMEVRSRRVGGANFQIPYEVRGLRQLHLSLMWLIGAARERKATPYDQALAQEITDGYNGLGVAVKKKEDMHRMAEANRAFAHFAKF